MERSPAHMYSTHFFYHSMCAFNIKSLEINPLQMALSLYTALSEEMLLEVEHNCANNSLA